DYTTIKAPIPGRVGVVRVTPGNLVRANDVGDGLVTITQLKPLRVSFSLPERDLDLLRAALARTEPAPVRAYASGSERPVAADTRNEVAAVASGIQPGEKVVVEGQQRLRNGSRVVEKDSGDKDQPGRTAQVE